LPIYPDDWNTVAVTSMFVGRSVQISKVTASVQVQFSGVGDLNVFMWSPEGTRTKLLERNCGSLVNIDTTFDDSASSKYADFCPVEAGRGPFRGNEPLANWNNQNAFRLLASRRRKQRQQPHGSGHRIFDHDHRHRARAARDRPNTVVSTSSFLPGLVAPGDQISILA
jgi:hypothetical protein